MNATLQELGSWREGSLALSQREREVFAGVLRGQTNKEIANALGCSSRTIEFHVSNILKKTGMTTRVSLLIKVLSTNDEKARAV